MSSPIFQQFQNSQQNPAMMKVMLQNRLSEMQSSGVNAEAELRRGMQEGKYSQQQLNAAYRAAEGIARSLFGYRG